MIKVLIVDDSHVESELIAYILRSDPEISIIASAVSGEEALSIIKTERPDVITMDIVMPGLNGFETTRRIMETTPVPIIIVSATYNKENVDLSFKAMEAGALIILEKPVGLGNSDFEWKKSELISTVKLMSEIKVVGRKSIKQPEKYLDICYDDVGLRCDVDIIAIGASTGGPQALHKLLVELKGKVHQPILIVQHISIGFTTGFAEWLSTTCSLNVKIPANGEKIENGYVYVAPDSLHMGVKADGSIVLSNAPPENNLRPSVAHLFRSVAESFGPRAIGILLSGMGRDGADELKLIRDKGAITFAQNEESSVVFGMPGEAVKLGAAVCVLSPEGIARKILEILKKKRGSYGSFN